MMKPVPFYRSNPYAFRHWKYVIGTLRLKLALDQVNHTYHTMLLLHLDLYMDQVIPCIKAECTQIKMFWQKNTPLYPHNNRMYTYVSWYFCIRRVQPNVSTFLRALSSECTTSFYVNFSTFSNKFHIKTSHDTIQSLNCVMKKIKINRIVVE